MCVCIHIHIYMYIYAYMCMYTLRDGFHQVFTSSASSEALNPLILSATTAIAASSTSSSLWGWVNHNQPCGHMKHMMTNITYQCTIFACYWDIMGWYVYYNIYIYIYFCKYVTSITNHLTYLDIICFPHMKYLQYGTPKWFYPTLSSTKPRFCLGIFHIRERDYNNSHFGNEHP